MIKTIEIIINNGINIISNILIIPSKNVCYSKDKEIKIDSSFTDRIIHEIYNWKNEYGENDGIDREEFTITITTSEGTEVFHGKGIYPSNYEVLKRILGELND